MNKEKAKNGCASFAALAVIGGGFSSAIKSGSRTSGIPPFIRQTGLGFNVSEPLFAPHAYQPGKAISQQMRNFTSV